MKVTKRDGRIVEYDGMKIVQAVGKAMKETTGNVNSDLCYLVEEEVKKTLIAGNYPLTVEGIQDSVENTLMSIGDCNEVAKNYILYRAKRNEERKKGWKMTELQKDIYLNKYKYENESFDEFINRVSGGNSDVAKIIRNQDFSFGGRILAGRGLNRNVTMSNCYVLPQPEDNIESIFDVAKMMARTYSYGGGVGTDLSLLRPEGAKVNNAALTTSGPVSFMDLYDVTTAVIGQKGRRGALMLSMSTEHPDIDKFIKAKSDTDKINHANISVRSSGEFFKLDTPEKRKTLRLIAENNWATGEPGMLFWDRVEEWHLLSKHPKYELYSTNPCFTGDMEVLTTQGYKSFKELAGSEVDLINIDGDISRGTVWYTGDKETIQLTLSNHKKIKCTPDHRFLTKEGKEVEAKNLKGERLHPLLEEFKEKDLQYVKYGFIQGDGGLTRLSSKSHKGLEVYIGESDEDIRELFKDEEFTEQGKGFIYLQGNYPQKLKSLGFSDKQLPERDFPSTYNDWTIKQKASFLQGMYSANGSVITNHRVSYKTTCIELAHQLLDTLENDFGITGYITTNKPTKVKFDNGVYVCKQSYDVNISRYDSLQIFHREINFYHQYKKDNLKNLLLHKAPKVISIKELGVQPVYDFNEPKTNWGVVEGFIAHNCGEQPLPPFGNCLLGSINLSNFIKNPFTKEAYIDYSRLEEVIRISIVGLNEVLHEGIPLHPLKEQRETANKFRQIGLGIMGLSDMFIKLGIKYGSDKSIELSDELGKFIRNIAIEESISLVGKYGVYPEYNYDYIKESSYFKSLPKYLQEGIKTMGMANSHVLSIAPTGSISTMFGVSGGIEPIFANSFTRTTKSLATEGDVEYKVYTEVIQELMDIKGIEKESDLPEYCITSHDIDPQDRIRVQAVWQKYIDSAISSTINLKEDTTVKDIENIYIQSYASGLKGVTVFRDNCFRTGILNTEKPNEDDKFKCPECGHVLNMAEGCNSCPECGWGQCSI